jgi:hypothetical protein
MMPSTKTGPKLVTKCCESLKSSVWEIIRSGLKSKHTSAELRYLLYGTAWQDSSNWTLHSVMSDLSHCTSTTDLQYVFSFWELEQNIAFINSILCSIPIFRWSSNTINSFQNFSLFTYLPVRVQLLVQICSNSRHNTFYPAILILVQINELQRPLHLWSK